MNHPLLDAILSNVDVEDATDGDVVYRVKTAGGDFVINAIAVRTEDRMPSPKDEALFEAAQQRGLTHGWTYSITDWTFEPAAGPVVIEARPWTPEMSK